MIELEEATDGAIFPFGAQPEEGIRSEHATKDVTSLSWLAFLLTGAGDISIDIAADACLSQAAINPFFATWIRAWSRKIVISKAVAAIRDELRASVRRTEVARVPGTGAFAEAVASREHQNSDRASAARSRSISEGGRDLVVF